MNSLIVYDSQYGNTALLARAIGEKLDTFGSARVVAARDIPAIDVHGIDLLIVGGPTQARGVSPTLRTLLDRLHFGDLAGITAVAFDTRMSGPRLFTGSAAGNIAKKLEGKAAWLPLPPESFVVTGKEGPLAEGEMAHLAAWTEQIIERATAVQASGKSW